MVPVISILRGLINPVHPERQLDDSGSVQNPFDFDASADADADAWCEWCNLNQYIPFKH